MNVTSQTRKSVEIPKKIEAKGFFGYNPPSDNKNAKMSQIKTRADLNVMLFKIKKFYNELTTLKGQKETNLGGLKEKSENFALKIKQMEAFKNIELQSENISVREMPTFREAKEQIQSRIENLIQEKKDLEEIYKTELEYSNTLTHLITTEKINLENSNEKLVKTQDKIMAIKVAKKNLDANTEENNKKVKIFKHVVKDLEDEIMNMEKLKNYQQAELDKLTGNLESRENFIREKKLQLDNQNWEKENELRTEKQKVLEEIRKTEELKNLKLNKEREYIKLVLGLDIIKKYYVDVDKEGKELNNSTLIKSEDFKTFSAEKYHIYDENSAMIVHTNSNSLGDESNQSHNIINNTINNNVSSHRTNSTRVYLKRLKEKFDNLDLDYDTLYNFYSKIITKTGFYHTNMVNFNLKIISLESKKELYTVRVRNIMKYDYKNFDDLVKNNSRFENFMRGFQEELRTKREEEKNKAFLNDLNKYFTSGIDFPPSEYSDFYNKCIDMLSIIKAYYEFLQMTFKNALKDVSGVNSANKPELKQLEEFLKQVYRLIKDYVKVNIIDDTTKRREDYVNDILNAAEFELNPEVLKKLEKEYNFSISDLKNFIQKYEKNFFSLNLSMEKLLFNYFRDSESKIEINTSIYSVYEKCISNNKNNIGNTPVSKTMKSIQPDEELDKMLINWDKNNESISDKGGKRSEEESNLYQNLNNSYNSGNAEKGESQHNTSKRGNKAIFLKKSFNNLNHGHGRTLSTINLNQEIDPGSSAPLPNIGGLAKSTMNFNINKKIIDKLYMPIIEKRIFNVKINENIAEIKKNTRKNATLSHELNRKKKQINSIANELIIYNNPNINLDALSNNTYNSFVRYVISHQLDMKTQKENENYYKQIQSIKDLKRKPSSNSTGHLLMH